MPMLVLLGLLGGVGYFLRDSAPIQKLLGKQEPAAPLPATPFPRPTITSADYSVTLSAVQNGVPNNVTTKVQENYATALGQSTVESQMGGQFTATGEIRTADYIFRPGQAYGKEWSRQPRVPETPSPYDAARVHPHGRRHHRSDAARFDGAHDLEDDRCRRADDQFVDVCSRPRTSS